MPRQANRNGRFSHLIFFILTIILGMQAMRMLIGLLLYILRDNLGQNNNTPGLLAFIVFATSFLIGMMRQRFGLSRMWRYPALLLGPLLILTNIFFNFIAPQSNPLITLLPLFLTILAVAAFLQFLPNYLLHHRDNLPFFIFSFLFGLAADTALHGASLTYDFVWHNLIGLLLIFAAQLAFLLLLNPQADPSHSISLRWSWGFMLFGPYFFLQMLLFQNVARLTAVTGWQYPWSFSWIIISHIIGLVTAVTLSQRQTNIIDWVTFALLLTLSTISQPQGWLAAAQQLAGQISNAALLTLLLLRLGAKTSDTGLTRSVTVAYGLGFLLNTILVFVYYIPYDTRLPFANTAIPSLAAILISGITLLGLRHPPTTEATPRLRVFLPLLLLLAPFYTLLTTKTVEPAIPNAAPPRVITYNLHNGFHPYGYMDLEALAQVIESENADIIALQEVSRGWVINGSTDMLTWLSQRLALPYISNPTADPLWGNALLSRYPITDHQLHALPPDNLLLNRGFITAEINIGNGQALNIVATHLHHPSDGSQIRQQQAHTIIDYAQNQPLTLIMGDLNAEPGTPEMLLFQEAGYTNIVANEDTNKTFPSLNPTRQIDYIWITPDLTADLITIPATPASDHLPIAATISSQ